MYNLVKQPLPSNQSTRTKFGTVSLFYEERAKQMASNWIE